MKKYRIGFDFDGVIANTDKIKKQYFEKKSIFLKKYNKSEVYFQLKKQYSIEFIDKLYNEMSNEIFTEKSIKKVEPIIDAIESIKKLSNDFEIYIITSRTNRQILQVKKWIEENRIRDNIEKIISASEEKKDKLEICEENGIVIFCDDDIRHLIYKEKYGGAKILFNSKIKHKNDIVQVNDWKELMNYIYKYNGNNNEIL